MNDAPASPPPAPTPDQSVFLAVPTERELVGARNADGSPVRTSLASFVYEYAFCEWDAVVGEHVANQIWRRDPEWIAAYLRLAPKFSALMSVPFLELRADDHARLFAAIKAARIPASVHTDLMPFVAAVACPLSSPPATKTDAPPPAEDPEDMFTPPP